ncbi:MAG: CoB--CoM heterodisulfide reductase iron-sulfur subunit A family protein [Desulfobacteraceae bacterium]|nr:MAG: CoB--CoM heterodisulfide reductase iron-sulfur subunit A family protein [Desulfobacteraceae bacterium]
MSDAIRIGVFVCHCGSNIGGVVNVPEVVEYAKSLPLVDWAEGNLYTCSEDGLSSIRNRIHELRLNRVVVASCTPRTHEPLFRKNCERAGLNKYLFEFVNLREHCSWVHMDLPEEATRKAKDLIRMGVAKVGLLKPREDLSSDVIGASLVLGGGISGLAASLTLANQGYRVELVEKQGQLGGLLRSVNRVFPTQQLTSELLDPMIRSVLVHKNIHVHLSAEVEGVKGFVGNFEATVRESGKSESLRVGTIIVATGAETLRPEGLMGYGRYENVMTQLEFEERHRSGYSGHKNVVIVNCVGARIEERTYCGRFCCIVSMKNGILLKEADPAAQITILQRDVMACGKLYEDYYRKALEMGIRFLRYSADQPPEMIGSGKRVEQLQVFHTLMGKKIVLKPDLVVLTTPLVPGKDNPTLAQMMKIPLGMEGFFLEAHQKLRPVEFPADGIYVAGAARYPAEIPDCIGQAFAAAAKAAAPMARGKVVNEAFVSEVNSERCSSCGRCIEVCPFGAVDWTELKGPQAGKKVAKVNPAECKGCGLCAASCLSGAIGLAGSTDEQVLSAIANLN